MSEMSIGNDLIEAYKGHHGDALTLYYLKEDGKSLDDWVKDRIMADTPKQRLEVYLEWNGILGYSSRIYELATGEL